MTLKRILLFLSVIIIISCEGEDIILKNKVYLLQKQNDSLTNIINDINAKYVFDSIALRTVPSLKNTYRPNSVYEMEIYIVAYGGKNYFVAYETIFGDEKTRDDTLQQTDGIFKFETILSKKKNPIRIDVHISNEYGKTKNGFLYDVIKAKP